jgi:hypothetical protein
MSRTMYRDEADAWFRKMREFEEHERKLALGSGRRVSWEDGFRSEPAKTGVDAPSGLRGRPATAAEADAFWTRMSEQARKDRDRADFYLYHDAADGPYPGDTDPNVIAHTVGSPCPDDVHRVDDGDLPF